MTFSCSTAKESTSTFPSIEQHFLLSHTIEHSLVRSSITLARSEEKRFISLFKTGSARQSLPSLSSVSACPENQKQNFKIAPEIPALNTKIQVLQFLSASSMRLPSSWSFFYDTSKLNTWYTSPTLWNPCTTSAKLFSEEKRKKKKRTLCKFHSNFPLDLSCDGLACSKRLKIL